MEPFPYGEGKSVFETESGELICDGCSTPFKTHNQDPKNPGGVYFKGWIMSGPPSDERSGGVLGGGNHSGPWAYCWKCFHNACGREEPLRDALGLRERIRSNDTDWDSYDDPY